MTVWLTVASAAEYIRGSKDRIRAALKNGELVGYAYGSEIRLTTDDIDNWLMSTPYEPSVRSVR